MQGWSMIAIPVLVDASVYGFGDNLAIEKIEGI